jgi:hypothetical protein
LGSQAREREAFSQAHGRLIARLQDQNTGFCLSAPGPSARMTLTVV